MSRSASILLCVPLALVLGACAQEPAEPAVTADPPPPVATSDRPGDPGAGLTGACDAQPVEALVGQEATDAVVEQARADAGAEQVRTLAPGQAVTMEFNANRLNLDIDEDGTITAVRCG